MIFSVKFVVVSCAIAMVLIKPAHAVRIWDPGTDINFQVTGSDASMAPSNEGDNGIQQDSYYIQQFSDMDTWIDDDEAQPVLNGYIIENLPYANIEYSSEADSAPGGGLEFSGSDSDTLATGPGTFIFTAPNEAGEFDMKFTGSDGTQAIPDGETGNRKDADNSDNWWDIPL